MRKHVREGINLDYSECILARHVRPQTSDSVTRADSDAGWKVRDVKRKQTNVFCLFVFS